MKKICKYLSTLSLLTIKKKWKMPPYVALDDDKIIADKTQLSLITFIFIHEILKFIY